MASPAALRPRPSAAGAAVAAPAPAVRRAPERIAGLGPDALVSLGLGLLLAAVALGAGGGLQLAPTTRVEVALQVLGGTLATLAVLGTRRRADGAASLVLLALLAVVTGLSVLWAVQPDDAWLEANRTLAYLATFAAGVALVRLAPGRWAGVIGATLVACVVVTAYALITKVMPGSLAPQETYARLREPFGYWNAVGLMAALGVPGCLWLGARRTGHAAVNALAFPAVGVLVVGILLAYSRGSLLAAVLGCVFWFVTVPLRLRGVAVLAAGSAGAIPVAMWAFARDGLSEDKVGLDVRTTAGHELGVLLVAMVLVLLLAGLAVGFVRARRAPRPQARRRAGIAVLVALALIPVGVTIGLALSDKGLGDSVSSGFRSLTDPNDKTQLSNDPGRLTAVGSVRARYYDEALKILKDRPVLGAGAGGYATARPRFRRDDLDVRHAHGYLFQVAADLGVIGLVVSVLLVLAWALATDRAAGLSRGWRRQPFGPERIGMLTLTSVVVVFGVHSTVDWTWFVPGTAALALLCAGWVAGRGAEALPEGLQRGLARGSRPRQAVAGLVVLLTAGCVWATLQPLRSVNVADDALARLEQDPAGARAAAQRAHRIDPLSIEPLQTLAAIESSAGRTAQARRALEQAVQLQPQNPASWLALAAFELHTAKRPAQAIGDLGPALYLDPRSVAGVQLFLDARRQAAGGATP